jgi:transposase
MGASDLAHDAVARRWLDLDAEIKTHDAHLEALVEHCAPTLVKAYGIKAGTAAERLILVGDNPNRIHSEGAFAKLCGTCPIPASSGKVTRYRLNRGSNRQANAAWREGRASPRSFVASNASWRGKSSICVGRLIPTADEDFHWKSFS